MSKYVYMTVLLVAVFAVAVWVMHTENETTRGTIEQVASEGTDREVKGIVKGTLKGGREEAKGIIPEIEAVRPGGEHNAQRRGALS